jgi:hypothetical protein
VAEDARFDVGDALEIAVGADDVVQLHRVGAKPDLAQMAALISPENRYAEVLVGAEMRREIVEW